MINIGSFAGSRIAGRPHYPYSAAMPGLQLLAQALAKELEPDHIIVNTIALGVFPEGSFIMRDHDDATLNSIRQNIPAGRFWFARRQHRSDRLPVVPASSYSTGARIALDGGMHVSVVLLRTEKWTSVLPSIIDAAERDPDIAAMYSRLQHGYAAPFETIILRAMAKGELPENTDTAMLIAALTGPLFYRRWFSRDLEPAR